ncbi:MAG: glycosyltransferase family 4 protein [Victivallales bacterium]|nr:glycosyltransferase family 4 protein [Victivallales bacterium]
MKILFIHNEYAKLSGEEQSVINLTRLLAEHGHTVELLKRSSAEISDSLSGKIKSFFTGIHNPCAVKAVRKKIADFKPDIVQVQNLYPLFSPSIIPAIKNLSIPVVMRCPNYRLFCPNGLCYDTNGQICEMCFGGHELNCFKKNCLGSSVKSLGYAIRNAAARMTGRILNHVDMFIVQTEFQRQKFIQQGISENKLAILPSIAPQIPPPPEHWSSGTTVTFIGRVSPEKGIFDFLKAAENLPHIPFTVAGSYDDFPDLPKSAPKNIKWLGFLRGEALLQAYLNARIVVVPSRWYEGFPNVIVTAMMLQRPVIATDLGAASSIITNDLDGRLFPLNNIDALISSIAELYNNEATCRRLAFKGYASASTRFSAETVYETLIGIYLKLH